MLTRSWWQWPLFIGICHTHCIQITCTCFLSYPYAEVFPHVFFWFPLHWYGTGPEGTDLDKQIKVAVVVSKDLIMIELLGIRINPAPHSCLTGRTDCDSVPEAFITGVLVGYKLRILCCLSTWLCYTLWVISCIWVFFLNFLNFWIVESRSKWILE